MKKYLLGLFAVVLAIGFSAFQSPKESTLTRIFTFTPSTATNLFDASSSYWVEGNQSSCSAQQPEDLPCVIEIPQVDTDPYVDLADFLESIRDEETVEDFVESGAVLYYKEQ